MADPVSPISTITNYTNDSRFTRMYNNQFFDYLSEQTPKNVKEMFKWCEVVYNNTPVLVNGIKKLVSYPITDFTYDTKADKSKEQTQEFLEKTLNIKSHLISLGLDYYIYGNAFRSVYFPFVRWLECGSCKQETNIIDATYKVKNVEIVMTCGHCHKVAKAKIVDKYTKDLNKIKLVTWDPFAIELVHNPVTDDTTYYYKIPSAIRNGIMQGSPTIMRTIPELFIKAVKENKNVEFNDNFFALKVPTLAGVATGWGMSPLIPTLKLFLYTAILRKSVEAIGLEHITPQRILYPQGTSNDPTQGSSMARWKEQVQKAINRWRIDPNYIMIAPYPTGVTNLGSQGRNLMPTAEIKQSEEDMLRALDIPIEFVMGLSSANLGANSIALRILDNQLYSYMDNIKNYVNWVVTMVNANLDKSLSTIGFTPFRLVDDINKQQMIMSMAGRGVSTATIQEMLGLDAKEELDNLVDDAVSQMKTEKRIEKAKMDLEQDISIQTQNEQTNSIPQYNQQQMIAKAQQMASQFLGVPYEQRRSYLAQLQNEDYVMWALVSAQLESLRNEAKRDGTTPIGQ
jgi:hypothetical protein